MIQLIRPFLIDLLKYYAQIDIEMRSSGAQKQLWLGAKYPWTRVCVHCYLMNEDLLGLFEVIHSLMTHNYSFFQPVLDCIVSRLYLTGMIEMQDCTPLRTRLYKFDSCKLWYNAFIDYSRSFVQNRYITKMEKLPANFSKYTIVDLATLF